MKLKFIILLALFIFSTVLSCYYINPVEENTGGFYLIFNQKEYPRIGMIEIRRELKRLLRKNHPNLYLMGLDYEVGYSKGYWLITGTFIYREN